MKILIALSLFILVFIFLKRISNDRIGYLPLYFSIVLFYLAFDISFSDKIYRVVGVDLKLYINTATIIVIALVLVGINRKTFSITWEYLFFIPLFISIFMFGYVIDNRPMYLRMVLNYLSIYLCLLVALETPKLSIDTFLSFFDYLAIMNGLLGIAQMVTNKALLIGNWGGTILYTEGIVDGSRAVGIAGSNNSGGNLAAILFVISVANYLNKKKVISIVAIFTSFIFCILTQTRIALVAIFISILLYYVIDQRRSVHDMLKKYIIAILGAIFVIIVVIITYSDITQIFFLNRGSTQDQRLVQFQNAWEYAISIHPFIGIGAGQWRSFLYNHTGIVDIPIHSQYLNYWVENGVIIFILNIIFNFGVLFGILKNKILGFNIKRLAIIFFVVNFICSNFNPNEVYTLTNVLYYLVVFVLLKSNKENRIPDNTI